MGRSERNKELRHSRRNRQQEQRSRTNKQFFHTRIVLFVYYQFIHHADLIAEIRESLQVNRRLHGSLLS